MNLSDATTALGTAYADIQAFLLLHTVQLATAIAVVGGVVMLLSTALNKMGITSALRGFDAPKGLHSWHETRDEYGNVDYIYGSTGYGKKRKRWMGANRGDQIDWVQL